jgi:hypothetical protein
MAREDAVQEEEETRREEGDDRWGPDVSGWRRGSGYPFGFCSGMGRGRIWGWANLVPLAFYSFLYFFFIFFSDFLNCFIYFPNLIQTKSNKFLKYSIVHYSVLK